MGVLTRMRDIVNSNLNAVLEKAEDPEKMLRLIAMELEESLAECRAARRAAFESQHSAGRDLDQARASADRWAYRAQLAVERGRDELARDALLEKRACVERAQGLEQEKTYFDALIAQYDADSAVIEEKLKTVRERLRERQAARPAPGRRHAAPEHKRPAPPSVRFDEAFARIEAVEQRIDRAAGAVCGPRRQTLEEAFADIELREAVEHELAALRRARVPAPVTA